MHRPLRAGDKVACTGDYLNSTPGGHKLRKRTGVIREVSSVGMIEVATVDWTIPGAPDTHEIGRLNVRHLRRIQR